MQKSIKIILCVYAFITCMHINSASRCRKIGQTRAQAREVITTNIIDGNLPPMSTKEKCTRVAVSCIVAGIIAGPGIWHALTQIKKGV
jgi:hypothetical protein